MMNKLTEGHIGKEVDEHTYRQFSKWFNGHTDRLLDR